MSRLTKCRRGLPFSIGTMLVLTALSAILVYVWLPNRDERRLIAKNLRIAAATSQLWRDVSQGKPTAAAEQLTRGADPNSTFEAIWGDRHLRVTALNIAIRNADEDCISILLETGADPNLEIPQAPLLTTLECNIPTIRKQHLVNLLLNAGADLRSNPMFADRIIEEELPQAVSLLKRQGIAFGPREMCIAGDLDSLKKQMTIPLTPTATRVRSYRGTSTLLGIALSRSHVEIAAWLLRSGASIDVDDVHQANALHLAVVGNCVDILQPLILAGCDINAGDITGDTPLDYAISSSRLETIVALLALGAKTK